MSENKTEEQVIFLAAVELPTPAERAAYLRGACGDNAELRASVEGLLASHDRSGNILDAPPVAVTPLASTGDYKPITEGPGMVVGPYKLLQQIGEGGFGTVFMAEQETPIRRKVALKIIKPGMETALVLARFESERVALALM